MKQLQQGITFLREQLKNKDEVIHFLLLLTTPLDETHLVVVRGLIHQEVSPKCVNKESSTVISTDLLNCNPKT